MPSEFAARFGVDLEVVAGPVLAECRAAGILEDGPRVLLTRRGRQLHSEVSVRLLVHLRDTANA